MRIKVWHIPLFLASFLFLVDADGEDNKRDVLSLRYYYNGAWRNSPPLDEENDYFWDKDRKERFPEGHIHRPGSGYIYKDGRWEVDRNTRRGKHQTGEYFYDGKWHARPKKEIYNFNTVWLKNNFRDFITRKDFVCDIVEREYELGNDESKRLLELINSGTVEKILGISRERDGRPLFVYDKNEMVMYAKARADLTGMLMTLVMNATVFDSCAKAEEMGMKCEFFSLVDPVFYENDAGKSDIIMEMNISGVLRLLDTESSEYRRSGASFFVFPDFCTMVIVNQDEKIKKIRDYLNAMPYSPVKGRKRLLPQ